MRSAITALRGPRRPARRRPPATVCARELYAVLTAELARRGLSLHEFDRMCVERFADAPRPCRAGTVRHQIMELPSQRRVHLHSADRLLIAAGLHLIDLPGYREQIRQAWGRAA